jgi:DNA-binding beta-propeller fold protein YncE
MIRPSRLLCLASIFLTACERERTFPSDQPPCDGPCVADLYVACFNTSELRAASADLEPAGVSFPTDAGPIAMAWLGGKLFVANSLANTVSHVSFDPPAVRSTYGEGSIKIPSNGGGIDLEFIEAHDALLYVSNASVGTIVVVSPDGGLVDEIALAQKAEDAPNPQGIAFVGEKGYVALNGTDQIAILDVSTRTVSKWIDVSGLASPNGDARPARFAEYGSRLFVTLWNVDASWAPMGSGRLAVIDTATDELDSSVTDGDLAGGIDLGADCVDPADLALLGDALYVTCGPYAATGAVVRIDLSSSPPFQRKTIAVPEGVSPGKLAFCKGVGYFGDRNLGRVFRFEPDTEQMTGSALCPAGTTGDAYVPDIVCGP